MPNIKKLKYSTKTQTHPSQEHDLPLNLSCNRIHNVNTEVMNISGQGAQLPDSLL